MANSYNHCTLLGNVGQQPVLHVTGTPRLTFSVATSWRCQDKATGDWEERTDWTDVVVFNPSDTEKRIGKGTRVLVAGPLRRHQWVDQNQQTRSKHEVNAQRVVILSSLPERAQDAAASSTAHPPAQPAPATQAAPVPAAQPVQQVAPQLHQTPPDAVATGQAPQQAQQAPPTTETQQIQTQQAQQQPQQVQQATHAAETQQVQFQQNQQGAQTAPPESQPTAATTEA